MTPMGAQRQEELLSECIVSPDMCQVCTWQGWYYHMALSLMSVSFPIGETHRGQQIMYYPQSG